MVIAATDDTDVNIAVFDDAEQRAMLVNVVDVPPLCNFILPAIVRTGPLAIAISTAGASPALAKRMKREIEEHFGEPYARLAVLLNEVRGWAKDTLPDLPGPQGVLRGDRQRRPRPGRAAARRRHRGQRRAGGSRADRAGAERTHALAGVESLSVAALACSRGSLGTSASARRSAMSRCRSARRTDARRIRAQRRRQDDAAAGARDAAAPARGPGAGARREPPERGAGRCAGGSACSATSRCSIAS